MFSIPFTKGAFVLITFCTLFSGSSGNASVLRTENGAAPGALNRLSQAVADRALRRLQPVVHDFNNVA